MIEDMSRDRWNRLRTLLNDALERDHEARAAYLDEACAGDPELHAQLDRLLANHEAAGVVDAVVGAVSPLVPVRVDKAIGRRIGAYRVAGVLGHGGMGAVYLGERADGQFEQRVAIKIIRTVHSAESARQRFLEERQILARLVHPNIARLLDGGITDDGEPYFAMEHVEGEPIDAHCAAHGLSVTERLRLFQHVCNAVQYAHRNLIVHRDLKPSNILVTADGVVKLLDFGIAKLISDKLHDTTPHPTTRVRWLTPEYSSPEQVRGEPVTTASDVYALGVILYELLAGRRPYEIGQATPTELERIVCESQPEPPSAVTRDALLRRRLEGDLDTIVLQALRKEPAARYGSASELADDIERYLSGLPVRARPATFTYRASKFVRRHRLALAAAVITGLSLVGGIVGTTWQAGLLSRERDRVRAEANKAERVSKFLISLFEVSDPSSGSGSQITARELLDRGSAWVNDSLAREPEAQATMMYVIGQVYQNLGLYDLAQPQLERALALRREVLGEQHIDVSTSLQTLGLLLSNRGNYQRAESLYHQALAIRRELVAGDDNVTGVIMNDLALILQRRGELEAAQKLYEDALTLHRRTLGNRHIEVAKTLNNLGSVKRMRGDYDGADPPLREALELKTRLLGREHPSTSSTLNQLGVVLHARGNYAAAESLYQEVLAMRKLLLGDSHPNVGGVLDDLGSVYYDQERYALADSTFRRALAIMRAALGPRHGYTGLITGHIASVLHATGDPDRAEPLYREAIATLRAASPAHPELATPLLGLGRLLLDRRDAARAEPFLTEALAIRKQKLAAGDWKTAEAETALGACLSALGRFAEAEPLLRRGSDALRVAKAAPAPARRRALSFLAVHAELAGQSEKAAR